MSLIYGSPITSPGRILAIRARQSSSRHPGSGRLHGISLLLLQTELRRSSLVGQTAASAQSRRDEFEARLTAQHLKNRNSVGAEEREFDRRVSASQPVQLALSTLSRHPHNSRPDCHAGAVTANERFVRHG